MCFERNTYVNSVQIVPTFHNKFIMYLNMAGEQVTVKEVIQFYIYYFLFIFTQKFWISRICLLLHPNV